MKRLGKNFRDVLVCAEHISLSGKINEEKIVLSVNPDISSIRFLRFPFEASSDRKGKCQRILSSLADYSKPLHLSKQTLFNPLKYSFSILVCLHNPEIFVLCAQVRDRFPIVYIIRITNRILSSEIY